MVTGGLGFIGTHTTRALLQLHPLPAMPVIELQLIRAPLALGEAAEEPGGR